MKKRIFFYLVLMCCTFIVNAKNIDIYPTNWWVGMKTNSIQLLILSTGEAFSSADILINYSGIKVLKTHQFSNKRYLAVDILISPDALPGNVSIEVIQKGKKAKN